MSWRYSLFGGKPHDLGDLVRAAKTALTSKELKSVDIELKTYGYNKGFMENGAAAKAVCTLETNGCTYTLEHELGDITEAHSDATRVHYSAAKDPWQPTIDENWDTKALDGFVEDIAGHFQEFADKGVPVKVHYSNVEIILEQGERIMPAEGFGRFAAYLLAAGLSALVGCKASHFHPGLPPHETRNSYERFLEQDDSFGASFNVEFSGRKPEPKPDFVYFPVKPADEEKSAAKK